ncbi:MAG: NADH-quinone oxidoreductase subunit NuoK [Armatimonadota bacterium]|nr:NADH-quinone oxidoreductase subunit NuoK [Armatimonadota bacterium]MCX7776986.1 NADH-quinone oxidoreductase subunit NuoK [Armatimonadota bacterium]MDW8024820.1 NADH-quinone oxidoreductase subunit NuoK [Armatimonadota bacterium]
MVGAGLMHYLVLSALLFSIGIYGVLTRRNAIAILMGIELMLNAVNLNFVAVCASLTPNQITGQIFAAFVIVVAAAEACIGFALIIAIYRNFAKVNVDDINIMRW